MTVEQVQKLTQNTQQVLKERCNETYYLYRVTFVSAQQWINVHDDDKIMIYTAIKS